MLQSTRNKKLWWTPADKASLSRRMYLSQLESDKKKQTKGAVKHSQGLEKMGLICSEGWLARETYEQQLHWELEGRFMFHRSHTILVCSVHQYWAMLL